MRETPKAAAAYAEYAAMGPERSLRKLADKTGTKLAQLGEWSTSHNWQERVKGYDAQRAEERRRKQEADIEKMNDRQAQIGVSNQKRAIEQIERLITAEKFGSQAAVMLLKLALDVERTARGAPSNVQRHEMTGEGGGPLHLQHEVIADDAAAAAFARALLARVTGSGPADTSGSSLSGE